MCGCVAVRIRKKSTKPLLRPGLRQVVVQCRNSLKCVHRLYSVIQLATVPSKVCAPLEFNKFINTSDGGPRSL